MIARIIRGGGFRGCLAYILRRRAEDKDQYTLVAPGPGGGTVTCPVAPVAAIVIRTTWHGAYIGTVLDHGNLLTATGYPTDKSAAWHLAAQAAKKGWGKVESFGSDEFLRWNYDFLLSRGIGIKTKDDHQAAILAAVKANRAAAGKETWTKIVPDTPPPPMPLEPKIVGGNMIGQTTKELCREFAVGRRQRPGCKKPVWHSPLSLAIGEHLSQEQWQSLADEYVKKMGFGPNHDYVVVQHFDRAYEHIHIVVNRIGTDGLLWAGKWEAHRAHKITNELAREFRLQEVEIKKPDHKAPTIAELSKMERTGKAPDRVVLQQLIDTASAGHPTTANFLERLKNAGVIVRPNIATTGRMSGFSFAMANSKIFFSGSKLGRKYTWKKLLEVINYEQNRDSAILSAARDQAQSTANTADKRNTRVDEDDLKIQSYRCKNQPTNQHVSIINKRSLRRFGYGTKNNGENTESRAENKRDDYSHEGTGQEASNTENTRENLGGGNNKRHGWGDYSGDTSNSSSLSRWLSTGPYQILSDWWMIYQEAKHDDDTRKIIKRLAGRIRGMITSKADIFPIFQDEGEDYYVKAVAEILRFPAPGVANLRASEIDDIVRQIMMKRDRPAEHIKSVLSQSPTNNSSSSNDDDDDNKIRIMNEKIISEIVQELSPQNIRDTIFQGNAAQAPKV